MELLEQIVASSQEQMTAQARVCVARAKEQLAEQQLEFIGFLELLCEPPWCTVLPAETRSVIPDVTQQHRQNALLAATVAHERMQLEKGADGWRLNKLRMGFQKLIAFCDSPDAAGMMLTKAELERELQDVVLSNRAPINLAQLQNVVDRASLNGGLKDSCGAVLHEAQQLLEPMQKVRFAGSFDGSAGPRGTKLWRRNPQLEIRCSSNEATVVHLSIHDVLGSLGKVAMQLCCNRSGSAFNCALPSCTVLKESDHCEGNTNTVFG